MVLILDNNIVIDFLTKREPFYELSKKVVMLGVFDDSDNFITITMLTDIYYILQKDYGSETAQELIEENLRYLSLVGTTADDAYWCLQQRWDDFEDCLVARCAENIKADFIVTRDNEGFTRSLVPPITPVELFELLEARGITYHEAKIHAEPASGT